MSAALSFNGTTLPRVPVEVTNKSIKGNDGGEWQGIIGIDVIEMSSMYFDRGRFLMLAYEQDELAVTLF